jgi:hypothetical protein
MELLRGWLQMTARQLRHEVVMLRERMEVKERSLCQKTCEVEELKAKLKHSEVR